MSSRARGDHDTPSMHPWRATRSDADFTRRGGEPRQAAAVGEPGSASPDWSATTSRRPVSRPTRRAIIAILVVILAGAAYASHRTSRAHTRVYPGTPRAWLATYLSAGANNPRRACGMLFTPELASRYRHTGPGSCAGSVSAIEERHGRIRRIVQSNGTAVIELRQMRPPYAWNVVLARHRGGWQAVDVIRGR